MSNDTVHELLKMISQKKNFIPVLGHLVLVILVVIGLNRSDEFYRFSGLERTGLRLDDFLSCIDGLFFARCLLAPTFVIIMPILICTVAGDLVAGEMQDGSLRLYASRTRGRIRIMLSKIAAMSIFSTCYCIYFGLVSLVIGYLFFGCQKTQIVPLVQMGFGTDLSIMSVDQSLIRYAAVVGYYCMSVMVLGSLTLLFSTLFNRMTTATVAGITLYFVSYILENLPLLSSIKPYLLSYVMNGCVLFWLDPVTPWRIAYNMSHLVLYVLVFLFASILIFRSKDIT